MQVSVAGDSNEPRVLPALAAAHPLDIPLHSGDATVGGAGDKATKPPKAPRNPNGELLFWGNDILRRALGPKSPHVKQ